MSFQHGKTHENSLLAQWRYPVLVLCQQKCWHYHPLLLWNLASTWIGFILKRTSIFMLELCKRWIIYERRCVLWSGNINSFYFKIMSKLNDFGFHTLVLSNQSYVSFKWVGKEGVKFNHWENYYKYYKFSSTIFTFLKLHINFYFNSIYPWTSFKQLILTNYVFCDEIHLK